MDIKHVLVVQPPPARLPARDRRTAATSSRPGWVEHDGGEVEIGHDGERVRVRQRVPAPPVRADPLRAGRPARSPAANGWSSSTTAATDRPELWLSDGWAAVQPAALGGPAVLVARRRSDGRGGASSPSAATEPVDPTEPVCHVSYYEADAFAHWTGCAAPDRDRVGGGGRVQRAGARGPWTPATAAAALPAPDERSRGRHRRSSVRCGSGRPAPTPLPRVPAAPGAVGEYNGKFMVNQHVLRGGCCVTPPATSGPPTGTSSPPAARWAFSGLRLARDLLMTRRLRGSAHRRRPPQRSGDLRARARGRRPRGPHRAAEVASRRCGSTTRPAAGSSRRSPGCPSTTRPGPSAGSSSSTPPRSPRSPGPTRWSSSAPVPATRPGSFSTRCAPHGPLRRYVPFDVSDEFLATAAAGLIDDYEGLHVHAVVGDFRRHLDRIPTGGPPAARLPGRHHRQPRPRRAAALPLRPELRTMGTRTTTS